MKEKILFIVDSPGDLNAEDIKGKDIWVQSVLVNFGGVEREEHNINVRQFWKDLIASEEIPKTTMIVPDDWLKSYRKAQSEGYTHVIVYTLSSTASGICNSAMLAAKLYAAENERAIPVEVVDSRSYAFLYGRHVLECAEMAAGGASFADLVSHLKYLTCRNQAILWVYTLKHLKRSGRISGMAAFVGETLGLRPLLLIRDGVIAPIDKVRGDKNIVPRAVQLVQSRIIDPSSQRLAVLYADVPREEVERTVNMLGEAVRPRDIITHEIGCVISINCGPIAMAAGFYGEPFNLQ